MYGAKENNVSCFHDIFRYATEDPEIWTVGTIDIFLLGIDEDDRHF